MASLINKKFGADIRGLISVEDGRVTISVNDVGDIDFSEFIADFVGKEDVKITVAYDEQLT